MHVADSAQTLDEDHRLLPEPATVRTYLYIATQFRFGHSYCIRHSAVDGTTTAYQTDTTVISQHQY
jgi:hypothetical protein